MWADMSTTTNVTIIARPAAVQTLRNGKPSRTVQSRSRRCSTITTSMTGLAACTTAVLATRTYVSCSCGPGYEGGIKRKRTRCLSVCLSVYLCLFVPTDVCQRRRTETRSSKRGEYTLGVKTTARTIVQDGQALSCRRVEQSNEDTNGMEASRRTVNHVLTPTLTD